MPVAGGWILSESDIADWKAFDRDEYDEYVEYGLFDEDTGFLADPPSWMVDGIANNGPFDFKLSQSQQGHGW